jgi:acyl-CoA synthetase (AMP-forming)/AMP-acid ligase II
VTQPYTSIPASLLATAERLPEAEAVVDGDVRISFAMLARAMVDSTRAAMAAGIRPGDRAALWAPNGHRWIIAALGVLGAGGILVPLNSRFKGGEAAYSLALTRARLLFTDTQFLSTNYPALLRGWLVESGQALPELRDVVVLGGDSHADTSWERYLAAGSTVSEAAARERIAALGPDDVSDIMFTSGTTGRPKGSMATHGQVLRNFGSWIKVTGLRAQDRYLIVTPFSHTFGYKSGLVASFMQGAVIVSMPVFDVHAVLATVQRERITFLPGPPTLLHDILECPERGRYDLSTLRTAITGAAEVPVELVRALREKMTFETIFTGYGLTETNGPASMSRAGDDPDTIANFSGCALPDTEMIVAGSDGAELPRGDTGEILVRGYHVTAGYFDDAEATAAAIDSQRWLHTGDVGVMDQRGYVRVTGRIKDMFSVGGFKAYPAEVENLLLANRKISQVSVIGVPDARLGEVGMAFVVLRADSQLDAAELIAWARERMANYKVPRYVEVCQALPLNALGKIVKEELRERAKALLAAKA